MIDISKLSYFFCWQQFVHVSIYNYLIKRHSIRNRFTYKCSCDYLFRSLNNYVASTYIKKFIKLNQLNSLGIGKVFGWLNKFLVNVTKNSIGINFLLLHQPKIFSVSQKICLSISKKGIWLSQQPNEFFNVFIHSGRHLVYMIAHVQSHSRTYNELRLHDSSTRPAKAEPAARHSGANGEIHKCQPLTLSACFARGHEQP